MTSDEAEEVHLPRDAVVPALRAALYWSGAAADWSATAPAALHWLAVAWGAGDEHLPLTLVHDLGRLLLEGHAFRLASGRDLSAWPPEEQTRRLAYEERVLGRWLLDASVDAAHLALVGVPPAFQPAACAHALRLALGNRLLKARLRVAGNAAHLRALSLRIADGLPSTFAGWAEGTASSPEWLAFADEQLQAALAALPAGPLFAPEDLWEVEHFRDLQSDSQRLALRQIHAAAARIGPAHPGLASRVQRAAPEVATEADDADQFPAGGFDAIAQQGRFENLVRSEVAYVGETVLPGGIDVFDVRFVLGELLYYTRDESPLHDAHRRLTLAIDGPAALREKHPELPTQTLVLLHGLYLALHHDLTRIFGAQAASTHLRWRLNTPEDRGIVEEEEQLLHISLTAALRQHRATLGTIEAAEIWPAPLIVLSPRAAPNRLPRRTAWVRLEGPRFTVHTLRQTPEVFLLFEPEAPRALADKLLLTLFGG